MLVCLKFLATFLIGSHMLVSTIVLCDKGLTPFPRSEPLSAADRRLLVENDRLQKECDRLERENSVLKQNVESLMKVAIIPPTRAAGGVPGGMIPPQRLPVEPIEIVLPDPCEKENP